MNVYGRPDPIEEAKITGRSEGVNATVTDTEIANALNLGPIYGRTPTDRRDILISILQGLIP